MSNFDENKAYMGRYTDVEGDFRCIVYMSEWHGFWRGLRGFWLITLTGDSAKIYIIICIDDNLIS